MNIFAQGKCMSPSEFECYHNTLISRAIGHELGKVREFYNMLPENVNFQLTPLVPQ